MDKLVATVEERRGGSKLIKLSGILDEHNKLDGLLKSSRSGKALINLSGVEHFTASGTRHWMRWLDLLAVRGIRPELVACSPAFVAQLNRIDNLARHALVKTFQAPYVCAACDLSKLLLVHVADLGPAPYEAPLCECDGCGAAMLFADDAATYFAFVAEAQEREAAVEAERHSAPKLARGSTSSGMDEKRSSQLRVPLRTSSPSLSVFQLPTSERTSQRELLPPPARSPSERPYLIAVVALLFCTVGLLAYVLLMR